MVLEIESLDAVAVVAAFRAGTFSPAAYAEAVSDRALQMQHLNTLQFFDQDYVVKTANGAFEANPEGALAGLPIVVKDNINSAAFPTSGGTHALLSNRVCADAAAVRQLRTAGGFVGAKAGMHELAFGVTSNNAVSGAIRNPHDPSLIPGGSSGGTAAAIAAGIFPAGLGTDTGGSCRIPAALCGVTGFRPSTARYQAGGIVPVSKARDTVGPLARSMRDIVLFDGVLAGGPVQIDPIGLSGVTLGVPRAAFFDDLDPTVAVAVEAQLNALSVAGARLVEVNFDTLWPHSEAASFSIVFYEIMRELPEYLARYAPEVSFDALIAEIGSPDVAEALAGQLGDGAISDKVYRLAMDYHRPAMQQIYARVFSDHGLDAIVFPTTPLPARPIGADETVVLNGRRVPTFPTYIRNTDLASMIGAPGISLPCPVGAGLPVGIEFDALPGQDRLLLAIASAAEKVMAPQL